MGTVIQFPAEARFPKDIPIGGHAGDATIIILPSIRIERHDDESTDGTDPTAGDTPPRSRRRRGSR